MAGRACATLWFYPLSRLAVVRGQMLRVLTGTRRGRWSTHALPCGFVDALVAHAPVPETTA